MKTILLTVAIILTYGFNSISHPQGATETRTTATTTVVAESHNESTTDGTNIDNSTAQLMLNSASSLKDTVAAIAGYRADNVLKK